MFRQIEIFGEGGDDGGMMTESAHPGIISVAHSLRDCFVEYSERFVVLILLQQFDAAADCTSECGRA